MITTRFARLALFFLLLAMTAPAQPAKISVTMDQPGHKVSPQLWGVFFEDINLSADGGIYPELVRNRSFEDADKPEHWRLTPDDAGEVAIDTSMPLNPVTRHSLRVRFTKPISILNEGYWGMNIV